MSRAVVLAFSSNRESSRRHNPSLRPRRAHPLTRTRDLHLGTHLASAEWVPFFLAAKLCEGANLAPPQPIAYVSGVIYSSSESFALSCAFPTFPIMLSFL